MHHKVVALSNDCILVIGGRKSPLLPNSLFYTLNISGNIGKWKFQDQHHSSDQVEGRWRHSATTFELCGKYYY